MSDEKVNGSAEDNTMKEPSKALLEAQPSPYGEASREKSGSEREGGLPGTEGVGGSLRINVPRFSMLDVESPVSHMAQIQIEYTPREKIVSAESVSAYLKQYAYLVGLPEDAVEMICRHMSEVLEPMMLQVASKWSEREGVEVNPNARFVHPELIRAQQGGAGQVIVPGMQS